MRSSLRSTAAKKISLRVEMLIGSWGQGGPFSRGPCGTTRTELYCLAGPFGNAYDHTIVSQLVYQTTRVDICWNPLPLRRTVHETKTFRSSGCRLASRNDRRIVCAGKG